MRQKKSNIWWYLIGGIIFLGIIFVAAHEVPLKGEHVEQVLENSFLHK